MLHSNNLCFLRAPGQARRGVRWQKKEGGAGARASGGAMRKQQPVDGISGRLRKKSGLAHREAVAHNKRMKKQRRAARARARRAPLASSNVPQQRPPPVRSASGGRHLDARSHERVRARREAGAAMPPPPPPPPPHRAVRVVPSARSRTNRRLLRKLKQAAINSEHDLRRGAISTLARARRADSRLQAISDRIDGIDLPEETELHLRIRQQFAVLGARVQQQQADLARLAAWGTCSCVCGSERACARESCGNRGLHVARGTPIQCATRGAAPASSRCSSLLLLLLPIRASHR